jgi:hypothetical protein
MVTCRLLLKAINREGPIRVVAPSDFVTEPGPEIDPTLVLENPRFTVYCFDPKNDAVLFVESGDPEAVDRSPFYYQGQIQTAVGLVSMPLEIFHRIAQEIPLPPKGLIFVHSVGRCGSTLISKVLQAVPSVHSLSEPDDLTQIALELNSHRNTTGQVTELMRSSIRWRCKSRRGPSPSFVAIKPRSEVMTLVEQFGELFPSAKHFFLYRNALSWLKTIFRNIPDDYDPDNLETNLRLETEWARLLPLVSSHRTERKPMNLIQIRVLGWITCVEGYHRLLEMAVPCCAAKFEDLVDNPIPILEDFFAFCGIESVDWDGIKEVLSRDSQAGTIFDRVERIKGKRELSPSLIKDAQHLIASRSLILTPDYTAPHTLRPN